MVRPRQRRSMEVSGTDAEMSDPAGWIQGDESAKEMLLRVSTLAPFLVIPPLHGVPLRAGNVVEIVGPSPSAKTEILIQVAINCILPKEWNGINFGGLERPVMLVDLDCRFDILRLSQLLYFRITDPNGLTRYASASPEEKNVDGFNCPSNMTFKSHDEELFAACLRRFLYLRCYNSFEFLAALKTMNDKIQCERDARNTSVHVLMIDSIGAFAWMDRTSSSLSFGCDYSKSDCCHLYVRRKNFSLQCVSETVVEELQKLLLVHPILVLTTKTVSIGDHLSAKTLRRNSSRWSSQNVSYSESQRPNSQYRLYRECMPFVWQSFVTHRIRVHVSDEFSGKLGRSVYNVEWLLPSLGFHNTFMITDEGLSILP